MYEIILTVVIFTHANLIKVCYGKEYLDRSVFDAVEDGKVKKVAELLKGCVNDNMSCSVVPEKQYDHYVIWDFVRTPAPSFLKSKVNIIRSLSSMTPMTLIHMKTPTHQRFLSTGSYYRNPDWPIIVEFSYQLSPETQLSACVFWTDGRSFCTNRVKAQSRSTNGGEIFRLKKSYEEFYIRFAFRCRTVQCILILRQIRLHGAVKSATPFPQNSSVLTDRAVLCVDDSGGANYPRLWMNRMRFPGRDMSHFVKMAIEQERLELEMSGNVESTTALTTELPVTSCPTTSALTTTAPETTTATPYEEELDLLNCNYSTSNGTEKALGDVCQSQVTTGVILVLELLAVVVENCRLFEPPFIDVHFETARNETMDMDLASTRQIFGLIRRMLREVPFAEHKTSTMITPATLITAYFVAEALAAFNQDGDSLLYQFILHLKIHEDVVERSVSNDQSEMQADSFDDTSSSSIGPQFEVERALNMLRNSISKDSDLDRPDTGPSWPLTFPDGLPILQVDKFENWFFLDLSSDVTSFQQTWLLDGNDNWDTILGTLVTSRRPTSVIGSDYYQCSKDVDVRAMPILYKFFGSSPSLSVEICLKFLYADQLVCSPGQNATECSNNWCGSNFANGFNSHPSKDDPFQVIAKIQSSELNASKEIFEPAILHVRWMWTDYSSSPCRKVSRPAASSANNEFPTCEKSDVPMVETRLINLPTIYYDNEETHSTSTEFLSTGSWYASSCALDFSRAMSKFNTPFTSLLPPQTLAITARISADSVQNMASENLACTSKTLSMKFLLSVTSPDLYVYICLFRDGDSVTYSCSQNFHSSSPEFPNILFQSDFSAEKIEISAEARNPSTTGTLTVLFESIEITCL